MSAVVAGVLSARVEGWLGIVGIAALPCPEGFREDRAYMHVSPINKTHVMAGSPDHDADEAVALRLQGEAEGPYSGWSGMYS